MLCCDDVVQAAKRMVQTMSKGLYSMSTVVQGEKLGQFLDTEMPSMDNLKVSTHMKPIYHTWYHATCHTHLDSDSTSLSTVFCLLVYHHIPGNDYNSI